MQEELTREILEKRILKERKTPNEIAKEFNISIEEVKKKIKFYRLNLRLRIIDQTREMEKNLKKNRTKKDCIKEFRKLKRELKRTPMLKELPKLNEGLRRDILFHWGKYTDFLIENNFGIPRPMKGVNRSENFARLASEAAINYQKRGKWSRSEEKVRVLLENIGLIEKLDWWHNFPLKSPTGGVFELDFYLPKWNLVIECDSFWHNIGESKEKDILRDQWVKEKLGCKTIRYNRFTCKQLHKVRKDLEKRLMINDEKEKKKI